MIWVHDYQLMLVPQMIRERLPEARHRIISSTSRSRPSEVFRIAPVAASRFCAGLLGADLVGFHTASYVRHFALGRRSCGWAIPTTSIGVRWERPDAFASACSRWASTRPPSIASSRVVPSCVAAVDALTAQPADVRLLLGDRSPRLHEGHPAPAARVRALLRDHPELRGRVRLVQVAVPSRQNVDALPGVPPQVDAIVGRINGAYGTLSWAPDPLPVSGRCRPRAGVACTAPPTSCWSRRCATA